MRGMGTANTRTGSLSRWLGWAVLGGVAFSWVALTLWVVTDPCTFDCGDFGRGRGAFALWILSLAAVPAGAWLLKSSYKSEGQVPRESIPEALGAKLLYLFSFAMLLITAYAAFHLLKNLTSLVTGCCGNGPSLEYMQSSWRTGAVFSAFGLAWFGLIGFNTLTAARRLDRSVHGGPSPALLWVAAVGLSLAAFAGAIASQFLIDRGVESTEAERGEEGMADAGATSISHEPTPGPVSGFLPVKVADKGSGYEISRARIEIRASNYSDLGNQYTVFLEGEWSDRGRPREQLCSYRFLSLDGAPVLMSEAAFSFGGGGRRLEDYEAITFFDSHMEGVPARAGIHCQDRRNI